MSGKSKDDFGHGSGKFITYMNIFSNSVASPNMTESIEIDDSQNKVRFGDVLFTTSSETPDEVGMSSVWLENAENTYLNSFCFGYRPTAEFNPYYLAYMLRSSSMRKKITFLAQGISRYNISKNKMMDIEMPIPSIDEQKQIGEYFANLDRLITLHQREFAFLCKEKSKKFRYIKNAWEQRKLGEYVSITSGEAPSKFEVGTELYVKVDDLNYNDKYVVDTQNKVAEHSTVKRVTKGSVVFPKRGAAIMTNKVRIMGIDSYMDTNMMALTSEKIDSEFLYNIISKEGLYKIADTSTIPQINNKHVEPYEVTIPSLDEQRKIGAYFKQLDHLITLHQCE